MAVINGIPVNFGFTGTNGMVITNFSGKLLLQTADQSKAADKEEVRSGVGDIVLRAWYDQHDEATLEFIITDTTSTAAAVVNTTLAGLTPGVILVISACASMPDLVATSWEVQSGAKITGSNTTAKKLSVPVQKRAGITAVAGA